MHVVWQMSPRIQVGWQPLPGASHSDGASLRDARQGSKPQGAKLPQGSGIDVRRFCLRERNSPVGIKQFARTVEISIAHYFDRMFTKNRDQKGIFFKEVALKAESNISSFIPQNEEFLLYDKFMTLCLPQSVGPKPFHSVGGKAPLRPL